MKNVALVENYWFEFSRLDFYFTNCHILAMNTETYPVACSAAKLRKMSFRTIKFCKSNLISAA